MLIITRNDFEFYHDDLCSDVGGGFKYGIGDPDKPKNSTEVIHCVWNDTSNLNGIRYWGTASYCRGYYWARTFCQGDQRWEVENDGHCHKTKLRYDARASVGLVCTNDEPPPHDDP